MIEGRVKSLDVFAGDRRAGQITQAGAYRFTYHLASDSSSERQVSLLMPVRADQYTHGALFPVFQMNLPEGFVRRYITERMMKTAKVNDMLFLALSGEHGTGRLSYRIPDDPTPDRVTPVPLDDILQDDPANRIFTDLIETYLMRTTAGIGGFQPKVLVYTGKSTVNTPDLIVKTGAEDYPGLAINEFLCLEIAKTAGMEVPEFWLSKDGHRLAIQRFDITDKGRRLGMEDFAVLLNRTGDQKYEGSYETVMKMAAFYDLSADELYRRIALSLILGDGDAHLRNFAVVYDHPGSKVRLSPVYDVVNTRMYNDRTAALKINKSRSYPTRDELIRFGERFGISRPKQIIEQIAQAGMDVLAKTCGNLPQPVESRSIIQAIEQSIAAVSANRSAHRRTAKNRMRPF